MITFKSNLIFSLVQIKNRNIIVLVFWADFSCLIPSWHFFWDIMQSSYCIIKPYQNFK